MLADEPDIGTGKDPREAIRAALDALGEPYASEMAASASPHEARRDRKGPVSPQPSTDGLPGTAVPLPCMAFTPATRRFRGDRHTEDLLRGPPWSPGFVTHGRPGSFVRHVPAGVPEDVDGGWGAADEGPRQGRSTMTSEDRTGEGELDPAVVQDYLIAVLVRDGHTVMRTADGRYTVVAPDGLQGIVKDLGETLTLTDLVRYARTLVGDGEPPPAAED
jgi:hypothetical protein